MKLFAAVRVNGIDPCLTLLDVRRNAEEPVAPRAFCPQLGRRAAPFADALVDRACSTPGTDRLVREAAKRIAKRLILR